MFFREGGEGGHGLRSVSGWGRGDLALAGGFVPLYLYPLASPPEALGEGAATRWRAMYRALRHPLGYHRARVSAQPAPSLLVLGVAPLQGGCSIANVQGHRW